MSCSNCSDGLCQDCCNGNSGSGRCNPCQACPENTVDCETLPSALDNFTRQFFGTIERTVINGQIRWVLPCNLDVGLAGNPRLDGEGLACYFLRLLNGEIVGLTGPKGDTGTQGTNGRNSYTIITSAFNAPTEENPVSQFTVIPSPVLAEGQVVFIPTLGWVQISEIFESSTIFTTLLELIPNSAAIVNPGTLILPVGPRGLNIKGDTGEKGDKGDQGDQGIPGTTGATGATGATGPAGAAATNSNGTISGGTTDFTMPASYSRIDFGTNDLDVVLPSAGTYLVQFTIGGRNDSGSTRRWSFKMHNLTTATDVDKSEMHCVVNTDSTPGRFFYAVMSAIVTVTAGDTIEPWAESSSGTATQSLDFATSRAIFIKLQ